MSKRRVTPEELELWRKVTRTTERMQPLLNNTIKQADKKPIKADGGRPRESPRFTKGAPSGPQLTTSDILPGLPEQLAQQPLKMDKKTHGRLKKGKVTPEARIDLHGMTLAQAQPALTGFILRAAAQQRRLVLVITGKGKNTDDGGPIPVRHGVLRHAVPQWLSMPPLAPLVLQVTEAHAKHGGAGAYYVYLRRRRQ